MYLGEKEKRGKEDIEKRKKKRYGSFIFNTM